MDTKSKLDNALIGLKKTLDRNRDFNKITFEKDQILISDKKSEFWGTIAYLFIVLLLPVISVGYKIVSKQEMYFSFFILILFLLLFGSEFYNLVRRCISLQINLKERELAIENINGVFKKCFPKRMLSFDVISSVAIVDRGIVQKYSSTRWKDVTMVHKSGKKIILASFEATYPDSLIAHEVKSLFDAIIWTEKMRSTNGMR